MLFFYSCHCFLCLNLSDAINNLLSKAICWRPCDVIRFINFLCSRSNVLFAIIHLLASMQMQFSRNFFLCALVVIGRHTYGMHLKTCQIMLHQLNLTIDSIHFRFSDKRFMADDDDVEQELCVFNHLAHESIAFKRLSNARTIENRKF